MKNKKKKKISFPHLVLELKQKNAEKSEHSQFKLTRAHAKNLFSKKTPLQRFDKGMKIGDKSFHLTVVVANNSGNLTVRLITIDENEITTFK